MKWTTDTTALPRQHAQVVTHEALRREVGDTRFLPAPAFGASFSTPTLDGYQAASVWPLAGGVTRAVGVMWTPPERWRAFDVEALWVNQSTAAGDVRYRFDLSQMDAGDSLPPCVGTTFTRTASGRR